MKEMEESEVVYILTYTGLCFADTIRTFQGSLQLRVPPLVPVLSEEMQYYQCGDLPRNFAFPACGVKVQCVGEIEHGMYLNFFA